VLTDLRPALRACARHPASTAAVLVLLAAGVGVATAVFSALNQALLRPPAGVRDPAALVVLARQTGDGGRQGFSHRAFLEYHSGARAFAGLAAARSARVVLGDGGGEGAALDAMLVTEGYLPLLGVRLAAGRHFLPEEERIAGGEAAALLAHRVWRQRFGGDPGVVGRRIVLNGAPFTVVGVLAPGFEGLEVAEPVDIWLPLAAEAQARPLFPVLGSDLFSSLRVVGRLAPGVGAGSARAELAALATVVERRDAAGGQVRVLVAERAGRADPGWRQLVLSWVLPMAAAAALLLALVVVNSAGILLARARARRGELAVRRALGAGRGRLARHQLAEMLVVALPAAAGALLVARLVGDEIARAVPGLRLTVDPRVASFALAAALAACCLAALLPALAASRGDPAGALRAEAAGGRTPRLWRGLIAGQIALSLALLTAAGLLLRSVRTEAARDLGFAAAAVYLAPLELRLAGYTPAEAWRLQRRLVSEIAALPSVRSASAAAAPPVDRGFVWGRMPAVIEGVDEPVLVHRNPVAPAYLEVLETGIVSGRGFHAGDDGRAADGAGAGGGGPGVAVINETLAARLGPGPVLGRTLRFPTLTGPGEVLEIIGVTRDVRVASRAALSEPEVLFPLGHSRESDLVLLFRPAGDGAANAAAAAAVRALLRRELPGLPPPPVESVRARRDRALADERLYARLTALCAGFGLLVAAVGLFGIVSFDAARRTPELGVRLALGASSGQLRRLLLREAARTVGVGLVIGAAVSLVAGRLLHGALHGISPADPATLAAAAASLVAGTGLAAWLAVRRLARLDPAGALRGR
jgi:putative ABC transport system permease protein